MTVMCNKTLAKANVEFLFAQRKAYYKNAMNARWIIFNAAKKRQ